LIARLFFYALVVFSISAAALAVPLTEITPGIIDTSASAHTIQFGADAHSQIFQLAYGITPKIGIAAELTNVGDDIGTTNISSFYLRTPVSLRPADTKLKAAAFIGMTRLEVDKRYCDTESRIGPTFGAATEYKLRPELSLYAAGSAAFLEDSLLTFDTGLRYEVRPNWFVSLGYRSYDVGGSTMGGFLVGANYRTIK
jgi:hypothetical protein